MALPRLRSVVIWPLRIQLERIFASTVFVHHLITERRNVSIALLLWSMSTTFYKWLSGTSREKNINKGKKEQETTIRLIQTIRTNDFVHVLAPVSSYSAPSRWRAANLFSIAAGKIANWPVPLVVQNTMFWPNTHIIHRRKFLARNPFKGGGEITKLARNERAHGGAKPPPKGLTKAW